MNLNLFTYSLLIVWIRTIYSQIYINFKILGENGDESAKGEYTRWKGKVGTRSSEPNLTQARSL